MEVEGGFRLGSDNTYGFHVAAYNNHYPLIIDPMLLDYSTYLSGIDDDGGNGIAVDSNNYAYITGHTESGNFPTKGASQGVLAGQYDAFVTKLDTTKSGIPSLIYSTYLGGSSTEVGYGIAVESGCAYVTGLTYSTDFPTLNQYQPHQTGADVFVTKFNNLSDEVGFWRSTTRYFYLDMDGDHTYDGSATERFSPFLSSAYTNVVPLAGDWDGDGTDEVGFWRSSTGYFYLDMDGDHTYDGSATERFSPFLSSAYTNLVPLVGNWDGL